MLSSRMSKFKATFRRGRITLRFALRDALRIFQQVFHHAVKLDQALEFLAPKAQFVYFSH